MTEPMKRPDDIPDWGWWLSQRVDNQFEDVRDDINGIRAELKPLNDFKAGHEAHHRNTDSRRNKIMGSILAAGTLIGSAIGGVLGSVSK